MNKLICTLSLSLISTVAFAQTSHKGFTFMSYLRNPSGTAVSLSGITVKAQVISNNDCVLMEEDFSGVNISNGYLSLTIGDGTRTAGEDPGFTFKEIYDNTTVRNGLKSITGAGCNYTPAAQHIRRVRISLDDNGTPVVATFSIRGSAYAVQSEVASSAKDSDKFGGKDVTDFAQLTAGKVDDSILPNIPAALLPNIDYAKLPVGTAANTVAAGNDSRFGNATKLQTKDIATTAPTDGQVLTWNNGASKWEPASLPSGNAGTVTAVSSANSYLSVATGTSTPVLTVNVGTAANTVAAGNDSRFTDSRAPSGAAGGDLSGTYPNPGVATVGGVTAANVAAGANLANAAASANTNNAIVKRDGSGGFSAGAVSTSSHIFRDTGSNKVTVTAPATVTTDYTLTLPAAVGAAGNTLITDASGNLSWGSPAATSFSGSLAGDVTGAQGATVVANVGGVTAANVAAGANLANAAVSTNTNSTIVKRDGSGGFSAGAVSGSSYILRDSGSNKVTLAAPATVTTNYTLTFPAAVGSAGQTLSTDASGNLSWVTPVSGTVTSVTASAPLSVATGTTTPALSISAAGVATDGYITSTNFNAWEAKLTSVLADGKIFVGNASNAATAVTPGGDVSMTNAGSFQVNRIQNNLINGAPVTGGLMKWDTTTSTWKGVAFPACTTTQTAYWNSGSDSIVCQNISYSLSNFGTQTANTVLAGPTSGGAANPTFRGLASADVNTFAYVNGTNSYGANANIGTGDAYALTIKTSNTARITIESGGNVGVGSGATSPRGALDVSGVILGKAAVNTGGTTFDFASTNLQYTTGNCAAFTFNNMKDGGSYMFAVQGSTSATCSFTMWTGTGTGALTVHMPPDHAATTASKHTIYNMVVMGSHVYVAWTPGY